MSLRIDTTELISGAYVIGETGLGVLGSAVPSTGTHGAGYLYNDLSLPADAGKEVRGLIITPPSAGTFFAWEDSSFSLTGAPDGTYTFTYLLSVDGVDSTTDIGYGPGVGLGTIIVGGVSVTEALTLASTQDAIVGYAVSNTETLNLSHSQTNVANFPATITEAMTLADSGSVQFGATSTISEAMTLTDSSSNVATLSASITESMTLADSPNASLSGDYTATQTEAMSLADTASNVAALSAGITEPMSLSHTQSNVASLSASISEPMTLADTSSSSLSGAAYSASITEAMTLGDTASVQAALSAALTEALSLGENATAAWMTYVSIVESLNLSDSRNGDVNTPWTASITEALGLADTVSSGSIGSSVRLFTNDIAVLTVPVPLFATTKTVDLIATTQSEAVFLS